MHIIRFPCLYDSTYSLLCAKGVVHRSSWTGFHSTTCLYLVRCFFYCFIPVQTPVGTMDSIQRAGRTRLHLDGMKVSLV
jgi:hypothetical protein